MLTKYIRNIINFFNWRYWLFLVIVVLVSYGQILWMQPWEDDNALFVKLANIDDRVGYFGSGPLGEGVYKYAAVPFIPIYYFFEYNTYAYFSLLLFLYILTTLVVYKVLSYVLGDRAGRVSGFIFAAGYITSDGFWRMANSATTSISIILISLFIYFYYKYFKIQKIKFYFFSLLIFFLAVKYSVVRDHYLFAVALALELIFLTFNKVFKSIWYSIMRLIPLTLIFYYLVIMVGDSRTGGVKDFIIGILSGKFYLTYGFLSSVTNLIIPDYITKFMFKFSYGYQFLLTILMISIYFLLRNNKNKKLLMSIFYPLSFIWIYVAKQVYTIRVLSISIRDVHIVTTGGLILIISLLLLIILKKSKKLYLLFMFWLLINVAAYSSYFPTVAYETINRYLAHSFFALAAIFGILYIEINEKNRLGKILRSLIIIYGILNISNAVIYQHGILLNRSIPVKNFYSELKTYLPVIEKGDILYFDVSKKSGPKYRDAISAAMIPDTGSFGWRYGVDRYDFRLVSSFEELEKLINEDRNNLYKIHSYWYSSNKLVDTTDVIKKYFSGFKNVSILKDISSESRTITGLTRDGTNWVQPDLNISLPETIESTTPKTIEFTLVAKPLNINDLSLPLFWGNKIAKNDSIWRDSYQIDRAMAYKMYLDGFVKYSKFDSNTVWQDNKVSNAFDNDLSTVWQSDRLEWQKQNDYLLVEIPNLEEINRITWIAGTYSGSIPTGYKIEVSTDRKNWKTVSTVSDAKNNGNQELQTIDFETITARFVKMSINKTFGGDSPMIAEFRVISSNLEGLNLDDATLFINNPFAHIETYLDYDRIIRSFGYRFPAKLYWYGNKLDEWYSSKEGELNILFDGRPHTYTVLFPAGGTEISKLKIADIKIPSIMKFLNAKVY